jgi:hypothetical protein
MCTAIGGRTLADKYRQALLDYLKYGLLHRWGTTSIGRKSCEGVLDTWRHAMLIQSSMNEAIIAISNPRSQHFLYGADERFQLNTSFASWFFVAVPHSPGLISEKPGTLRAHDVGPRKCSILSVYTNRWYRQWWDKWYHHI